MDDPRPIIKNEQNVIISSLFTQRILENNNIMNGGARNSASMKRLKEVIKTRDLKKTSCKQFIIYNNNNKNNNPKPRSFNHHNQQQEPKQLQSSKRRRPENIILPRSPVQVLNSQSFAATGTANGLEGLKMQSSASRWLQFVAMISFTLLLTTILLGASWSQVEAIKLQPEGREKFYWSGEQFVITCQNNNNIKNVKIRWIGPNNQDITEEKWQRVHAESTGPHGHRLVVMNATAPTDDGLYRCTLGSTDDKNPREHIEFHLKLYKMTSFRDTPRQLVLPAGQPGTLTCRVEFDPFVSSATVGWFRDQKPIDMFNDSNYQVSDYDSNRQLSQLTISPVTKQHDGIYTCRAAAVTAQLSKIIDHDIRLETHYAPQFDRDSHTVWVERAGAGFGQFPVAVAGGSGRHGHGQRPAGANANSRMRYSKQHYPSPSGGAGRAPRPSDDPNAGSAPLEADGSQLISGGQQQMVRVELRCSCQANPQARILWTSSQRPNFVLTKGDPGHVLDDQLVVEGHNTTSILTIGYSLEADWPHKRDSYICSASNPLGSATKTFTIEQGDPPPAFRVGQQKQYDSHSSRFRLTVLGPQLEGSAGSQSQAASRADGSTEIVPPVDLFRIRAESPALAGASEHKAGASGQQSAAAQWLRRQHEPSVNWSANAAGQEQPVVFKQSQEYNVSLGSLPSGQQRLYLEAHNAVGWSPNATYLGEYYIVSGASATAGLNLAQFSSTLVLLVSCLVCSSYWTGNRNYYYH